MNFNINEFNQKYEELEHIGEGSSAFVKKCKDKMTGNIYACKTMGNRDIEKEMSCKEEFLLLNKIKPHPNIIQAHEFIVTDSWLYNILEYAPGLEL
jgi:serine/threonine protein kinase